MAEHFAAQSRKRSSKKNSLEKWQPPPEGWIKCNFDAVVKESLICLSTIFGDLNGSVVHAITWKLTSLEPTVAETKAAALAIGEAASKIYSLCFLKVMPF